MSKLIFVYLITAILTSIFGVQANLSAQSDSERVEIIAITAEGITFYSRDTNGDLQIVGQLPSNFAVEGLGQGDWIISSTSNFALSNNGELIAFTAQNGSEAKLFIFAVGEATLQTHPIPDLGLVEWSPDGGAILLESRTADVASYIYEIASDQLTIIPHTEGFSGGFKWLPDGDKILFVGIASSCSAPCSSTDIYIVNRNGQGIQALTNMGLETSLPSSYVCGPTWNDVDQRVYYVVGCGGEGNPLSDNTYSVDLNGQIRLEVDWSNIYLESFTKMNGIHFAPDGSVYLAAMVTNYAGTETHWVVAKVISPQQPQIVFTTRFDGYKTLYQSKLSPQGTYVALNGFFPQPGGGDIMVVDTSNGQIVTGGSTTEQACDIQWLNDQNLLFTHVEGWCTPSRAIINYEDVNIVNVTSGITSTITTALNVPVWLIRNPEVQLPAPTPTPTGSASFPATAVLDNLNEAHDRPGEIWGAESGADKLIVLRTNCEG